MEYKFKEYKPSKILRNHLNLGGANPDGERIDVNSLYFERGSVPWLPVMGEYHFSRAGRGEWYEELCKMKAGGIDTVSTYLFWIYHEEEEGVYDFSGDLDIRFFIQQCARAGLDVVIRVGPWAHGECRNGGFPDWLLEKPFKLRENNEDYLAFVRRWYSRIYEEVKGLFYKDGGNIIAVQLENEFTDSAEHLAMLKDIAIECGLIAPLYTVTGWNSAKGARIPTEEVVPVFGGYCEAPWTEHTRALGPSSHYFFNRMRNDSAIGADLIQAEEADGWQLPYERYPFATCELGGGIQVTHHRRPIIKPMDIYALSLVKIGCGNNLVGYYMYHGGTNKIGKKSTFNESRATGYPNDYPTLSYDFQAPLSEYGEARGQYGMLNMLHMFVHDFGKEIAPMEAVDAEYTVPSDDTTSLRYGMRTDGEKGFVFVNHYQRLTELCDIERAVIDTGEVKFPPIDVKGGISFFMPFNMRMGKNILKYATAQPLCRVGDDFFFAAIDGIQPRYAFSDGKEFCGDDGIVKHGDIKIVTLTFEEARYVRMLSGKLYIGEGCDLYECGGEIRCIQYGDFAYRVWNGKEFVRKEVKREFNPPSVSIEKTGAPFDVKYPEDLTIGGKRNLEWYRVVVSGSEGIVQIPYTGDAAQLYADGELVADDYWLGKPWRVKASLLCGRECYLVTSELRDDFYKEW